MPELVKGSPWYDLPFSMNPFLSRKKRSNMQSKSDRYRHAVSHALAGFQLIEASLKDFINEYHKRINRFLPSGVTYEFTGKDFEEAALGKLVNSFDKMCSNKPLIVKLRKLQSQRDHLAHRALTDLYGPDSSSFDFDAQEEDLIGLAGLLGELLKQVLDEHLKFVDAINRAMPR
jgi:hypothetical protein